MAVNAFLRFEGKDIKGEAFEQGYEDDIQVLSWRWGMTQSGTFHSGTKGGGAGRVNVHDLVITKQVDAASADLMQHCCNGAHIPKAILMICKAAGDSPLEYMRIEMETVMVTSVEPASGVDEERVVEEISFNFAKFNTLYRSQDDDGAELGQFEAGWDIRTNRAV